MYHSVNYLLLRLISGPLSPRQIYFASSNGPMPDLTHQVDFPRLETVLEGEFIDTGAGAALIPGDVLYTLAGGWSFPQRQAPATTFSVLFGKQQLDFSIVQRDGKQYQNLAKQHVTRRGPRTDSSLLQTLNEMRMQSQEQQTARLVVTSLLSHYYNSLGSQIQTAPHSQALFEAIRNHIDERYVSILTCEPITQMFYISPNHLPHLFQKTGAIGFNEYLNHTRLGHAKTLLKGHDLKVKEVAHACGFVDSNYLYRLFRKNTECSPSEYRRQYHSQLTERPTTLE